MTYFRFLAMFVVVPIVVLAILLRLRPKPHPRPFSAFPPYLVLIAHIIIAFTYTTPWDNYLVATRVWWYDPELVTGIVFGYVPIEEYSFFILQTILTGLWVILLMRSRFMHNSIITNRAALRKTATAVVSVLWLGSTILLLSGYAPTTYLTLELSWALIPIGIQVAFGADILWHYRRLLFWGIVPPTLYLAATDAIAIEAGTWTIDPAQSTGILLGGILPIEEFIFFLITNVLVVFGMTLVLSTHSRQRFDALLASLRKRNSKLQRELS